MNIEELQPQVEQLEQTFNIIKEKREVWQESIKPTLIKVLSEITQAYKLRWHVQQSEDRKNHEGIILAFDSSHSGISEKTERSFKAHIKIGGALCFSQVYNGDVFVFVSYPYVEGVVGRKEALVYGKYSPEEITESFILSKVSSFIDEMTNWEKAHSSRPIGFNAQ